MGRGCGGFGTKVHAAVSGLGLPVRVVLSAAQEADVTHAPALLEGLSPEVVVCDKGYDCDALVEAIEAAGVKAVVPSRRNRKVQRAVDRDLYRERNLAERFWSRAKQYRRVATRYDKKAQNFLAFVHLASIMILLR